MKDLRTLKVGTIIESTKSGRQVEITSFYVDMELTPGMVWVYFKDVVNHKGDEHMMMLTDMVRNIQDNLLRIIEN